MEIQAPICAASVYTDRALVTRQAQVTLPPGLTELVIDDLPTTLVEESVRASGAGQALILGLEVSTRYHTQAPEVSLADLDREIETLQDQDQALQDRQTTLEARLAYLQGLVEHNDQLTRGIGLGRMGVTECENLLQFIATGLDTAHQERQSAGQQRRELARQLETLRQRRADLAGPPRPQERRRIAVTVEAAAETAFQLQVDYVVQNASWQPLYDLRLVGQQVSVTYRGQVTQRTGEPWSAVALTLSTARPSVSAVLPELEPWYLDTYRPAPRMEEHRAPAPAAMTMMELDEAPMAGGEIQDLVTANLPAAPVAQASVEQSGVTVVYRIARPADVPPDGAAQKVTVAVLDLPAKLDYVTAPKLVSQAYLRATVTNQSNYVLLPGPASIFYESDFVGATRLETVAPAQEFEAFLGADDNIRVERELTDREVDKALIGNVRKHTYGYRIELENLRDEPATITAYDQLPVPRHESIKVRLLEANPRPEEEDLGSLKWELVLPPHTRRELRFRFQVEHPRDLTVLGLPAE